MLILKNLNASDNNNPVDLAVFRIKEYIRIHNFKIGDTLPSEIEFASQLSISCDHLREAINMLQCYGIVKVQPQIGTIVNEIESLSLESLVADIVNIKNPDKKSLLDTRLLLEKEAIRLASIHRTPQDLRQLRLALTHFETKLKNTGEASEEDLLFHLKIVEASQNKVLKSLMLFLTPSIIINKKEFKLFQTFKKQQIIEEHYVILEMIARQDPTAAVRAMHHHLTDYNIFSIHN